MTPDPLTRFVEKYIPPRMHSLRRKMAQDLVVIIVQSDRLARSKMAYKLASQPLWKRIWVAITKDY